MSQFLDLSKLNLIKPLIKKLVIEHGYYEEGSLNLTFESYGYSSMYLMGNIPMLVLFALGMTCCLACALGKRLIVKNVLRSAKASVRDIFLLQDHVSSMVNFAVRFMLEVYLVVCISSLISLSKERQESSITESQVKHESSETHSIVDIVFAGLTFTAIALMIIVVSCKLAKKIKKDRAADHSEPKELSKETKVEVDEGNGDESYQARLLRSLYENSLMVKDNPTNEISLMHQLNADINKISSITADAVQDKIS